MSVHIEVASDVKRSPRVMQVESMFDLPAAEKSRLSWDVDMPLDEQPWNVGLVVGPSGAGKTTLARHLWPEALVTSQQWSDQALIDDFPDGMGIKQVTSLLTAVGLGSVPAWVRPFSTLSNGEAFRASIARALAEAGDGMVVVDEFTSVVDRQVAKVASHTVQKMVRRSKRQFVAVTCHYDVADWLQPDWVYDVAAGSFTWRSVQPHPPLTFQVHEVDRSYWPVFSRHHYLSPKLHNASHCFGAITPEGDCVAFTSYLHFPHPKTKTIKLGHRLVVLPDYQGLGLGGRLDDWLGQHLHRQGYRYRNVVAHPAMVRYYLGSPRWRNTAPTKTRNRLVNSSTNKALRSRAINPRYLGTHSFEYVPVRSKP